MNDPFETAAIRARVLQAWVSSPVRFREDANLEEDLVLGGYRDRVVVELAQNAADAALRAGVPGRLRLTLDGPTLTAANVGAPLDADGVTGLSTLRASAKVGDAGATAATHTADSGSDSRSGSGDGSGSTSAAETAASPVGRFGVGFAAVLAVCDEPSMLSRNGSVRFSASDARAEVERAAEHSDGLRAELARREGSVPVLRLPFPADEQPPQGFDTAVVLPLRDEAARKLVRNLLAGVDDALLLALPSLSDIEVDVDGDLRRLTATRDADGVCTITDGTEASRWRIVSASGQIGPELLADRPIEERARPTWALTWAVPCDAADEPRRPATVPVFHGPTPTDEPLGLPALLIATLPLDPTRRRLAPGALTDFLLDRAAGAYADLVGAWPAKTPGLLRLVPGPIADGPVDAELRRRIVALLAQAAILPAAAVASAAAPAVGENGDQDQDQEQGAGQGAGEGTPEQTAQPELLVPRNALVLTPTSEALVTALEDVIPGLLPAGFERDQAALSTLGVRGIGLADVVEAVAGLDRPPAWWSALYTALDGVAADNPLAFDALSALPVPLADGRTVRGPRGTLRPATGLDDATLASLTPLGLRVIHPRALGDGDGARLLERLGAQPAEPRVMLADPAVLEAVDAAYDPVPLGDDDASSDPLAVAEAVLALVRAADPRPGERFGLGRLLLPEADGSLTPAGELLVPDSALAGIVDPELYGFVDSAWVERWGAGVLHAAGVPDGFPLLRDTDVLLDPDTLDDELTELEGFEDWAEHVEGLCPPDSAPVVLAELAGVIGLETVRPEAWAQALELLARTPALRQAVIRPARLSLADGGKLTLPSATAWWLSRTPVLAGKCPADLVAGDDTALAGLYDRLNPADAGVLANDSEFLTALGVKTTARELLAIPGGPDELLDRLADADRPVTRSQLTDLYCTLAEVPADQVSPPDRLRATLDGELVVADADDVVVVDAPDLLPLLAGRPYLPIPLRFATALADLLDLDLASEVIDAGVDEPGEVRDVPEAVRALLPDAPGTYVEHDDLILADGTEVDWRVADGVVHTSTFDGLARGLAWAAGRWDQRHLVAAMLAEPERIADLLVEVDFE